MRLSAERMPASVPGDDGGLDIAVAVQHVAQDLLQPRQRRLAGDVVGRTNLLLGNQSEALRTVSGV